MLSEKPWDCNLGSAEDPEMLLSSASTPLSLVVHLNLHLPTEHFLLQVIKTDLFNEQVIYNISVPALCSRRLCFCFQNSYC
jgi:hypothetical protein